MDLGQASPVNVTLPFYQFTVIQPSFTNTGQILCEFVGGGTQMDIYGAVCCVLRCCGYPAKDTWSPASRSTPLHPPPPPTLPPTHTSIRRQPSCSLPLENLTSGKRLIIKPCPSALSILFLTLVMSLPHLPALWVVARPLTAQLGDVFPNLPLSHISTMRLWPMG